MTADEILSIPVTSPEALFSAPDIVGEEHRSLAKRWHSDISKDPQAGAVMAHINALKAEADRKIKAGKWEKPGLIELRTEMGTTVLFRFKRQTKFELGTMAYSKLGVSFHVESGFHDLFKNGVERIKSLSFDGPKVVEDMEKHMPKVTNATEIVGGSGFLYMIKTPDVFSAKDILSVCGGKIDPKHAAWMISGAYNIACYLQRSGLVHNGITSDALFISPEFHSTLLLGGWWYSVEAGEKMLALPAAVRQVTPPDVLASKRADGRTDLMAIKALGRELLGDRSGMLLLSAGIPVPMVTFLRTPSSGDAVKDYAAWTKTLEASFGPRRFTEMKIEANDIYNLQKGA